MLTLDLIHSSLWNVQACVIFFGLTIAVLSLDQLIGFEIWPFTFLVCLGFITVVVGYKFDNKIRKALVEYRDIQACMNEACISFAAFISDFEPFEIKNLSDARKVLDRIAFEIVRIEKLGQGEGTSFPNPFPKHDNHPDSIELSWLRDYLKRRVAYAAKLGVVSGDLKVHFDAAKAKWQELAAKGEVSFDYVI